MRKQTRHWKAFVLIGGGAFLMLVAHSAFLAKHQEKVLTELFEEPSFASVAAATADLRIAVKTRHFGSTNGDEALEGALSALVKRWATFSGKAELRIGSDPVGIAASLAFSEGLTKLQASTASHKLAIADDRDVTAEVSELERLGSRIFAATNEDLRADLLLQENDVQRSWLVYLLLSAIAMALGCFIIAYLIRYVGRVRAIARRDSLTGLQNRLTFSETLAMLINDPGPGNEVGLMLLDLDSFKAINDTLGHSAGDELLKAIARRLQGLPPGGLTLARLGGDEFAIIVVARSAHRTATNIAGIVTELLKEPFLLDGKSVQVAVSIGIASIPVEWFSAEDLLKFADVALYEAKSAGRNTFRVYNAKMSKALLNRRELEADLREAVAREELDLHFQPIVDLKSKDIVSFEALARWNHPRHGLVPPTRFIPLAEEIGLIKQIGNWVLEEACRVARAWPSHIRVCINLSAHQFDGHDLPATLVGILGRTGLVPGRVELEITESVLLRDNAQTLKILTELKALGVRIALDDFGTGYSSLAYLQEYPFDKIKIDRRFVREAASKPQSAAIIEAIASLASKLDIVTTAEGLETEQDIALVYRLGCNEGQGYFFDRPLTRENCLRKLNTVAGETRTISVAVA